MPTVIQTYTFSCTPCCGSVTTCCDWCNTIKYCVHFDDATTYMDGLPSGPYTGTSVDIIYDGGSTLGPPSTIFCTDGTSIKKVGTYWWNALTVPNLSVDLFTSPEGCYAQIELDITDPVSVISRYKLNLGGVTSYIAGYTNCDSMTFSIPCETFPARPPIVITLNPGGCAAMFVAPTRTASLPPCKHLSEDPITAGETARIGLPTIRQWKQCGVGHGAKGSDGNGYICGCMPWPKGGCEGCPDYVASDVI